MKVVKRRVRLVLGIIFALLGAYLFFGCIIVALIEQSHSWAAMTDFGVFGFLMIIAGAALCFEMDREQF